jgi:hypothetical protein
MNSHKMSIDTVCTIYDKDMQQISVIESPKEVEVSDDYIEFLVKEATGVIKQKEHIPMQSFVRNFMGYIDWGLSGGTADVPTYAITRSNGTKQTSLSLNEGNYFRADGPIHNHNYGIQVGTASNAVNWKDFTLYGSCSNGTSENQFLYDAQTVDAITTSGSLRKLTLRRLFLNESPSLITVRECAFLRFTYNFGVYEMLCRDVVQNDGTPINVDVDVHQTLEVTYNFIIDSNQGFVDNWLRMLSGNFMMLASVPVIIISGLQYKIDLNGTSTNTYFNGLYATGQWPTGICVGNDDVQFTSGSTYQLGNIISNGTSFGQLQYGDSQYSQYTASLVSQSMYSVMTRRFTNHSNNTVQVKEAGLIITGSIGSGATPAQQILIARKLTGTINLLAEQTLDVSFIFNVSASVTLS